MKKKPLLLPTPPISKQGPQSRLVNRHHVPANDLFLYARSFHKAAKTLAAFHPGSSLLPEADASPVLFMYRQTVELSLKSIVLGEGGNFLPTKPDPISVSKSHFVSWLAQFVCQIVTALKWEQEFRCEGVETLADFKVIIEEINSVDPGSYSLRCPVDPQSESSVIEFARKIDAVIGLLESTGDALAAEWDLRSDGTTTEDERGTGGLWPTIQ